MLIGLLVCFVRFVWNIEITDLLVLYLVKKNALISGELYFVEVVDARLKLVCVYDGEKGLLESKETGRSWLVEGDNTRVFGPIDTRRIAKPSGVAKRKGGSQVPLAKKDVHDYLTGSSISTLASRQGVSESVFKAKLDGQGLLKATAVGSFGLTLAQLLAHCNGEPLSYIASLTGQSESVVLRNMVRSGLAVSGYEPKRFLSSKVNTVGLCLSRDDIFGFISGVPVEHLCKKYGVRKKTVYASLYDIGIIEKKDVGLLELSALQLKSVIKGCSVSEIASLGEMTKRDVMKCLTSMGINAQQYNLETSKSSRIEKPQH